MDARASRLHLFGGFLHESSLEAWRLGAVEAIDLELEAEVVDSRLPKRAHMRDRAIEVCDFVCRWRWRLRGS
jgi:hypothetical protein